MGAQIHRQEAVVLNAEILGQAVPKPHHLGASCAVGDPTEAGELGESF